jgi:hypothetical protein
LNIDFPFNGAACESLGLVDRARGLAGKQRGYVSFFAIKQSLSILDNIDSSLLANHSARQTAPDNATILSHGNTSFVKMKVKVLATLAMLAMLAHALVSDPKWPESDYI